MKTYTKDEIADLKILVKTYKMVARDLKKAEAILVDLNISIEEGNLRYSQLDKANDRLNNLIFFEDLLDGFRGFTTRDLYAFMDGKYEQELEEKGPSTQKG